MYEAYRVGRAIIVPKHNVRYVIAGKSEKNYRMFHDGASLNRMNLSFDSREYLVKTNERIMYKIGRTITPPYWTLNCTNMCSCGFCNGHTMTRSEFVKVYCNGKEPKYDEMKRQWSERVKMHLAELVDRFDATYNEETVLGT